MSHMIPGDMRSDIKYILERGLNIPAPTQVAARYEKSNSSPTQQTTRVIRVDHIIRTLLEIIETQSGTIQMMKGVERD